MNHPEDVMLVAETLRGSESAASTLFRRHLDALFAFVYIRVGRDRALAEDLVQEAFVDAWRNLASFREEGCFPAWLTGIARRKIGRHFRSLAARPDSAGAAALAFLSHEGPGPAEALEAEEAALAVTEGLSEIRAEYREVLLGKYRDGLSLKEMALRFGTSPEAVSSKLQRAREAFKNALEKKR